MKKCSKYHFVSLLHEKYRSTFDNFVQPFNQSAILTNCGLATQALSRSDNNRHNNSVINTVSKEKGLEREEDCFFLMK